MTTLFGLSLDLIMLVLLAACLAIVVALAYLGLRHRILVALAWRNVPRRRAQTALIVIGLMLSTAIIASSFTTGDTMTYSTRSLIAASLGRVDEVIVARSGLDEARLGPNGLPGVSNGFFSAAEYDRLRPAIAAIPHVAGVAPAISQAVALVDSRSKQSKTKVTLIALPADYSPAFGALQALDGQAAPLGALAPDEIYINRQGAMALGARSGDPVSLYLGDQVIATRLRAVVRNGGPGGSEPAVLAPLPAIQHALGESGQITQIYVANQGDALSSDRWSMGVTDAIRSLLVSDASAMQVAATLRAPGTQATIAATPNLRPAARAALRQLVAAAQRTPPAGPPDPRLKTLLGDQATALALAQVVFRLPDQASRNQLIQGLSAASAVSVTAAKHQGLQAADLVGAAITSIFVGLGLFSIASGTLLTFLIFVMLAAERRTEMGIARAIGTQRAALVQMFLFEGGLYDLLAGIVGVLIGLGVGLGTVRVFGVVLASVDLQLTYHVEPRSIVIALCFGLLLAFATAAFSAWRVSRLNIVAALRGTPDAPGGQTRLRRRRRGVRSERPLPDLRFPALTVVALAIIWLTRDRPAWLPALALAASAAIIGAALTARLLLAWRGLPAATRDRLCFSIAGLALLVYWAAPFNLLHGMRPADLQSGVEIYVLAGIMMVAGAVWAVVYNADVVVTPLAALLGRLFPIAAVLRTSVAYALRQRFRTGMALAMFALVIFTMVVAAVLSTASNGAYGNFGAAEGGFDIRGDTRAGASIANIRAAVAAAPGVKTSDFAAIGTFTTFRGQAIMVGAATAAWQPVSVNAAGPGFLAGVRFSLAARASGYGSDAAVWQALATTPGLAVIGADALAPPPNQPLPFGSLTLAGVHAGNKAMAPAVVWVRANAGGAPIFLRVIGVLDPRAAFGAGITAAAATFVGAVPVPAPTTFYFTVAPGHDIHAVAQGLGLSFVAQGMQAQVLTDELEQTDGIRLLLNQLVESYLGLGLIVGIAALGVISTRAVVERRRLVGTLRALGFQRGMVQASFLLEASFVALVGAIIGIALGLTVARSLTAFLASGHPEIVFAIPWLQIAVIALAAGAAGLLATWYPARRAAGIRPADALRYE